MIDYIIDNWLEIFGTITGLLYLFLSIKQNILLWPLGIATSLAYIIVFYNSKFYADMSLQVYYVAISIFGWYLWVFGKRPKGSYSLPVKRLSKTLMVILLINSFVLFLVIAFLLIEYTDSPLPYWDSFTTALSIVATWMLAKKIIEHWLIWIVVDFISLGLYIYKDLIITAFLFFVYAVMAYVGYVEWRKTLNLSLDKS